MQYLVTVMPEKQSTKKGISTLAVHDFVEDGNLSVYVGATVDPTRTVEIFEAIRWLYNGVMDRKLLDVQFKNSPLYSTVDIDHITESNRRTSSTFGDILDNDVAIAMGAGTTGIGEKVMFKAGFDQLRDFFLEDSAAPVVVADAGDWYIVGDSLVAAANPPNSWVDVMVADGRLGAGTVINALAGRGISSNGYGGPTGGGVGTTWDLTGYVAGLKVMIALGSNDPGTMGKGRIETDTTAIVNDLITAGALPGEIHFQMPPYTNYDNLLQTESQSEWDVGPVITWMTNSLSAFPHVGRAGVTILPGTREVDGVHPDQAGHNDLANQMYPYMLGVNNKIALAA